MQPSRTASQMMRPQMPQQAGMGMPPRGPMPQGAPPMPRPMPNANANPMGMQMAGQRPMPMSRVPLSALLRPQPSRRARGR